MADRMTEEDISDQLMHHEVSEDRRGTVEDLRKFRTYFHRPNLANRLESPDRTKRNLTITRKGHVIQGEELNQLREKIYNEQYGQKDPITGNYD